MKYDEARNLIQDGDCIAVKGTTGFLTPFTKFFTRSPYSHVGIAVWLDGGLWLAEINGGGNHLIPLSQIIEAGEDIDVFNPPVEDRASIRKAMLETMRTKISYGIFGLILIGFMDWFRTRIFQHPRKMIVCSGYCVMIYEAAGWGEHSRMISPVDLTNELTLKFNVTS